MKKLFIFSISVILFGGNYALAQTYSSYYDSNSVMCPQDVYVCPDGTAIGRSSSNGCAFICPTTVTQPPVTPSPTPAPTQPCVEHYCFESVRPSYTYTSGCYTYYYNGYTAATSIVSYNCGQSYYPTQPVYTQPAISTPTQYYTYRYSNGAWYPNYNYNTTNYNYGYTTPIYNYTNTGYNYGCQYSYWGWQQICY